MAGLLAWLRYDVPSQATPFTVWQIQLGDKNEQFSQLEDQLAKCWSRKWLVPANYAEVLDFHSAVENFHDKVKVAADHCPAPYSEQFLELLDKGRWLKARASDALAIVTLQMGSD